MPMRVALLSVLSQVRFRIKQISKMGSCFFPSALCVSPAHLFSSSTNKIKLIRQIGGDFALQLKNTKIYSDLTDL